MQKTILTTILSLVAFNSILFANELLPDQIIKLDGKITATQESEQWLKITVPFLINLHPDLLKLEGKKPESLEEMFNPDFISGIKIRLWISFMNEFKRSALRGDKKTACRISAILRKMRWARKSELKTQRCRKILHLENK